MCEIKNRPSQDYSPRDIFEIIGKSKAQEVNINIEEKTIVVENRSDLYLILSSFNLVTFKTNGNEHISLDADGVPVLLENNGVKFENSFDSSSPNFLYPVTAKVGDRDIWTIMGCIVKALPDSK